MKLISLIPFAIRSERRNKKIQKTLLYSSLIPVTLYGFNQYQISEITKQTLIIQGEIADSKNLENEILFLESDIFNNTRVISGLSNEQFPLHRFLLFMSITLPEDMRLYSVTSENVENDKEAKEDAIEPKIIPAQSTDVGGSTSTENFDGEIISPEQLEEEKRAKQEDEQKKITETITSQKTIYIRGATLSINSLGVFMKELENNDYISKVDIQDIRNYYNGAQSYKFYELTVTLK